MSAKVRSVVPMRVAKWGYIVLSALFCVIGVLFIAFPRLSVIVVSRALGIVMVVFGGIKIVGYFSKDLYRLAFQYDLEFGVLLAVLGLIVLAKPSDVLNFIFIALGIAILTDGLFKIRISLDAKKFGIESWWAILALAILTGAVGAVLMFLPKESQTVLAVWLGISLLAEGILNLWVAVSTVKIIRYQQPDVIEAHYYETGDETK